MLFMQWGMDQNRNIDTKTPYAGADGILQNQ